MKKCSKCGLIKDESEFCKDRTKKDGLANTCKSCRKQYEKEYRQQHKVECAEYGRQYRSKHRDEIRERGRLYRTTHKEKLYEENKIYQRKRRGMNKDRLYTFKSPCVKCGEDRPYVIDFHHIDYGSKSFNISTFGSRHTDIEIKDEIKKCVCLCRNCHQEFHYFYGNKPKNPVEDLKEYLGGETIVKILTEKYEEKKDE